MKKKSEPPPNLKAIAEAALADTNAYDFSRQPFDQGMVNKLLWQRRHLAEGVLSLIDGMKLMSESAYPTGRIRREDETR